MSDDAVHILSVEGLHCAGCVGRAETALREAPGVTSASVNLATRRARLSLRPGESLEPALAALRRAGYPGAPLAQSSAPDPQAEISEARRRALIALALAAPVFLLEMGGHISPALHRWLHEGIGTNWLWGAQAALTSAALIGPGRVFFARGLPALMRGAPEMNSLVAIGAGAAWLWSMIVWLAPEAIPPAARAVYFEAAAVICALVLTGRWLEARARGRAGAAIRRLMDLAPKTALVERDGDAVEIPTAEIAIGDLIRLRPGETVPVDGVVTRGRSHLDESLLTGEPVPVEKTPGDAVTGGALNGSGALLIRAERVGAETALARIIAMVEQAQAAKLPVQALADRVVRWFVPAVIAVALLTLALWLIFGPDAAHALTAAVSVLIIACPCAMGLATPVSVMVGTGRAAQLGVLFRKGDALQRLEGARLAAFDKTGTLTAGRPVLTGFEAAGIDRDAALRLAAAAESGSEHPIARAVVAAAEGLDPPAPESVEALSGFGLRARVEGREVLVGSAALMAREGVALDSLAGSSGPATTFYLALDGRVAARLEVSDPIRGESAGLIERLHEMGLKTALISGDAEGPARAVAQRLGIDDARWGVTPGGKADALRSLRADHGPVVFIGDGVNDAPALAEADIGIAMGLGADAAIETADVVLSRDDPAGLATALAVSRQVMRNIRQNLFWAFAYNVALIPVAAGALYPALGWMLSPMLAAGAMALSSIFVLGNALRLRGMKARAPG